MTQKISPTVTVIISTYNRANLLGRAIKSVLNQTFADFELIVVDDASTDNTEEVVRAFTDPRIRFIRHEQNQGVSAVRNTGLKAALGDYVAFLDSDDEWLPQKLEKQLQVFWSNHGERFGAVGCAAWLVEGKSAKLLHLPVSGNYYEDLLSLASHRYCTMSNLLFKKQVLQRHQISFDETLRASGDWDFALRLACVCDMADVDEPLAKFHSDAAVRLTSIANASQRLKSRLILLDKYKEELERMPKALARHHMAIAMLFLKTGDFPAARAHIRIAARIYSTPRYILFWVMSLMGSKAFSAFYRTWKALSVLKHGTWLKA